METPMKRTLETLNFDNSALKNLPLDPIQENYVRRVPGACFSRVQPTPIKNPRIVAVSPSALALLDLGEEELKRTRDLSMYFSGNVLLEGSEPAAACYCGHQFGNFAGQLGDGRAMYLGEILNHKGERWEIQLKGAGRTPYSRNADGRAVLRSSIREFLCSEAMFYLGAPTTRAGTLVTSDSEVVRDILYNGNPINEKATTVLRIAPSFFRFGSFEICKPRDENTGREGPSVGKPQIIVQLVDFVIKNHFPEFSNSDTKYAHFFQRIVETTADMVAFWQTIGFCHGVMNTDNMSIHGITIDYGPFGFMEAFDPNFICNFSDNTGRYSYKNQPKICHWNLFKLAEALTPVLPEKTSDEILETYWTRFHQTYLRIARKKLGLLNDEGEKDEELFGSFLKAMNETGADFTLSFRSLSKLSTNSTEEDRNKWKEYILRHCCSVVRLVRNSRPSIPPNHLGALIQLANSNPEILEAMGHSIESIQSEIQKWKNFDELKKLTAEEKREKDAKIWAEWIERYANRVKRENETGDAEIERKRKEVMNNTNPKYILRNWVAQAAIEKAERGDFSLVNQLYTIFTKPYEEQPEFEEFARGPNDEVETCVS